MVSESGGAAPAAVTADPGGRRRRVFRMAAIAVGLGWVAVISLLIVGLTLPGAPTMAAGTPAHRPAVTSHPTVKPTAQPTVHPTVGRTLQPTHRAVPAVPRPPRLSGHQLSETSKEFATAPLACAPARKCANLGCKRSLAAPVTKSFASVEAAFAGEGIALPGSASSGNFDCGGFSYQAQQLAADGFGPGDEVAVAGKVLTLPQVPLGAPDEIAARGQVIHLSPPSRPATELGFLGSGEFGTQSGTVTITYAGGSKQESTLQLADWYSDVAVPGTVIAASGLWNVPPLQVSSFGPAPVSVYYAQVPLDPSKRIVSVTLPRDPNLHLFDIGVPSAAAYATVASAANDAGLVAAATASEGNFDGAGHSYNSSALAAKGLRSGAPVTAQGIRFTWPSYAPGQLDNIRTQGQTIAITGTGRVLGFLGAATLGTQRGTVTIQYSDGSTQTAVLTFATWRASHPAPGGTIVATAPWNQVRGAGHHLVSVYSATIPLEKGKTAVSVTLPVNIDMHVFAIAEGK